MATPLIRQPNRAPTARRLYRALLFPLSNPFPFIALAASVLFLSHFVLVNHDAHGDGLTIVQTVHCAACIACLVIVALACLAHIAISILLAWRGNGKLQR